MLEPHGIAFGMILLTCEGEKNESRAAKIKIIPELLSVSNLNLIFRNLYSGWCILRALHILTHLVLITIL